MTKLFGLSGSLRRGSLNAALLRAAAELMPQGATLTVGTIHGIPLYDADIEAADGIPGPVTALKDAIAAADGLLLATPEYNNSIPGVLKNAIDWLSRPPADIKRVFAGRPVALIGASPGGLRHHPQPERLAARAPHARGRAVDRGAPPRLARPDGLRRGRHAGRCRGSRSSSQAFVQGFATFAASSKPRRSA